MRCTLFRCVLSAPAAAVAMIVFTVCVLRGRSPPSPRLQMRMKEQEANLGNLRKAVDADAGLSVAGAKVPVPFDSLAQLDTTQASLGAEVLRRLQNVSVPSARETVQQLLTVASQLDRTISVIQVGACDGEWKDTNDPVQPLLTDEKVRALLLEPNVLLWRELEQRVMALPRARGRLSPLNAALCPEGGAKSLPFYAVSPRYAADHPEAPHWARKEIGSLLRKHLEKHRIPDEYIEEILVPCRTALDLFKEDGAPVHAPGDLDVLLVDAEGMDAEVVNSFLDLPGFRPIMVVYERQHMPIAKRQQIEAALRSRQYKHWDEDLRNSVAILNAEGIT